MAKKKPESVDPLAHDLPVTVSEGLMDAVLPEPLCEDEVIGDGREQSINVDGVVYHHTRDAADGRWVYRPMKPRRG